MRRNEHYDAKLKGEKFYFTGKPCKHGHVAHRFTSSKVCTECHKERCKERSSSDAAKQYWSDYKKANKESVGEYKKQWLEKNKAKTRMYSATRRSAKLQRTPEWLNDGEKFEIECVYRYASCLRNVGLDYEVDHITPLQGDRVSGLHVPWNLRVISMQMNRSKGNKHHE